jgi:hypothetical protein
VDPNATLARLRELARRCVQGALVDRMETEEMAELFEALDTWITRGGFLPEAWAREQIKAHGPIGSTGEE